MAGHNSLGVMKPQAALVLFLLAVVGAVAWSLSGAGGSPAPRPAAGPLQGAGAARADAAVARTEAVTGDPSRSSSEAAVAAGSERTEVVPAGPGSDGVARIRGRLVDADGAPRPGVQLEVRTWRFGGPFEVVADTPGADSARLELETDRDGEFVFDNVGRRSGTLSLTSDALVFADRARFEGTGADQELGDLLVVAAASVAGVVQDERGAPLAGVAVAAELGPMGMGSTSRMESREDGSFVVGKLRPGEWTLRATSSQFLPRAQTQRVAAGERVEGVVITLAAGAAVEGRVVDERGVGVAGAKVTSERKETIGEMEIVRFSDEEAVTTDDDGRFRLAGLTGERVTLKAYGGGHSTAVQRVETGAVGVVLQVERLGAVAGVLVTSSGAPIAGSRVRASTANGSGAVTAVVGGLADLELQRGDDARATTDAQGRFVVEGVRPGVVRVEAKGSAHLPAEQRGLQVRPAQRLTGLRLIADLGAIARVEVVDGDGEPVEGADVELWPAPRPQMPGMRIESRVEASGPGDFVMAGRGRLGGGKTDADGVAVIHGLPAADAVVKVRHVAFASPTPIPMRLPASGEVTQRVVMQEACYIDVAVRRADGAAAAGALVELESAAPTAGPTMERGKVDAAGSYRFGPLPAGRYTAVIAREPEVRSGAGMMMVVGGGRERLESSAKEVLAVAGAPAQVLLEMPVLTRLTGRVLGTEGPLAGVVVELQDAGDEAGLPGFGGRQTTSDGSGTYAYAEVEAGRYVVRYGKPGAVVKAEVEVDVPTDTPELRQDLALRTGSVRVAVLTEEDAEPVAQADVRLLRGGAQDATGKPRRAQRVMMVSVTSDGSGESSSTMTFGNQRVVTDEDGVATFSDVPVGEYTLEVESSRFSPVQRPGVAVVERQLTDLGIVEVAPAGQLRGVVEDQDGQRVMALVQCRPVGEEEWSRSEVAVQGAYRVRGMKPGRYEVRARSLGLQEGAPSTPVEVEVVAGKTKVADLRVTK